MRPREENGYNVSKVLLNLILFWCGWQQRTASFPLYCKVRVNKAKSISRIRELFLSSSNDISQSSSTWATPTTIHSSSSSSFHHEINHVGHDPQPSPSQPSQQPLQIRERPYEQRTKGPRQARRLNHAFRYLYRDTSQSYYNYYQNMTAFEYLLQYYSPTTILDMNETFPPLLELNVSRHVHPKIRFLKETLEWDTNNNNKNNKNNHRTNTNVPPQYFGSRLEKTIAPRHAFLMYNNLPHGKDLWQSPTNGIGKKTRSSEENTVAINNKFTEFLLSCGKTKRFCALCNQWREEQKIQSSNPDDDESTRATIIITSKQVEAFDVLFGRGVLAAARNDLVQSNNTWPLDYINISSSELLHLMIQNGANPLERDIRGTTLLHWAAGTGNLDALRILLPYFPNNNNGIMERTERDGATLLHWAAAGANSKEFGTGGHAHVCQYLLSYCTSKSHDYNIRDIVNQCTYDGNTPLMWAAWSGSYDIVKLLIRHEANWDISNRNGCTVAHWAASGGNLNICKYLAEVVGVNFFQPNHGGNTPLTHAVAFGRVDVVKYIRQQQQQQRLRADTTTWNGDDYYDNDEIASRLAADFVGWDGTDTKRREVLQAFQNDFWVASDEGIDTTQEEEDLKISIDEAQRMELEDY